MRKLLPVLVVAAFAAVAWQQRGVPPAEPATEQGVADDAIARAFASQSGNVQVEGRGTVVKVLADDNDGSRHQRFIVELASGQTVLIAHNIDLAPRVASLAVGDTVAFYGEYEWNPKGGVVHWTHHDPVGRHPAGWIKHNGAVFQ